mmetsp:Transcript_109940/g.342759  ORF Transcript_109940/g.342759 Transcript_109940/m.342759 type:complete len:239 (+) Transcript_109940:299-1015(+)
MQVFCSTRSGQQVAHPVVAGQGHDRDQGQDEAGRSGKGPPPSPRRSRRIQRGRGRARRWRLRQPRMLVEHLQVVKSRANGRRLFCSFIFSCRLLLQCLETRLGHLRSFGALVGGSLPLRRLAVLLCAAPCQIRLPAFQAVRPIGRMTAKDHLPRTVAFCLGWPVRCISSPGDRSAFAVLRTPHVDEAVLVLVALRHEASSSQLGAELLRNLCALAKTVVASSLGWHTLGGWRHRRHLR